MLPSINIFLLYAMPVIFFMLVIHMNRNNTKQNVRKFVYIITSLGLLVTFSDFFYSLYLGFPPSDAVEGYVATIKTGLMYTTQAFMGLSSISIFFIPIKDREKVFKRS